VQKVAPSSGWNEPAGQGVNAYAPSDGTKWPGSDGEQVVAPWVGLYDPAVHALHAL